MADRVNQHYVPKFYFRLFNGNLPHICVLTTKDGKVFPCAPIKGQCAKHLFYGSKEIESANSGLETLHSQPLRAMVDAATSGDMTKWKEELFPWLLQAVAFQRARTQLQVKKVHPAMEAQLLEMFKEHLRHDESPLAKEALKEFDEGTLTVSRDETSTLMLQCSSAIKSAALLWDLQPRVVRNVSDYPFIFSDSPVIFYNSYYRNITDRGVLGLQTPGLQVFLPLTPRLLLMMIDPNAYEGRWRHGPFVDVFERSDISALNALQLHHHYQAVYFADPNQAEYVTTLFDAHRATLVKPENTFVWGEDEVGKFGHTFEPHLPYNLTLSFVECQPIAAQYYQFRYRRPDMVKALETFNEEETEDSEYSITPD